MSLLIQRLNCRSVCDKLQRKPTEEPSVHFGRRALHILIDFTLRKKTRHLN